MKRRTNNDIVFTRAGYRPSKVFIVSKGIGDKVQITAPAGVAQPETFPNRIVESTGIIDIPMYREGEAPTTRPATQAALSSHYFSARSDLLPSIYKQGAGSVWTEHITRHTNPSWTQYTGFDPRSDAIGGLTPRFAHINRAAGTILNYYNPDDYALAAWKMDQALKPTQDRSLAYAGVAHSNLDFGNVSLGGSLADLWDAINAEPFPGYADTYYDRYGDVFKRVGMVKTTDDVWIPISAVNLSQAINLYEMFAFCASSVVVAVGGVNSMAGLDGVFARGVNLRDDLPGIIRFNNQNTGHSAQFAHSFIDIEEYWYKLGEDLGWR